MGRRTLEVAQMAVAPGQPLQHKPARGHRAYAVEPHDVAGCRRHPRAGYWLRSAQSGFDEVQAIVAPEQLVSDEQRRGAKHSAGERFIPEGTQAIFDWLRVTRGEQRIARKAQHLRDPTKLGIVRDVTIFGPGSVEQRLT